MAKKQKSSVDKALRNKFAIRDEKGRFVKIHPTLEKNLNITFKIQQEGLNNRFELFDKDPKLFAAFKNVVLNADLPIKVNHEKILKDIEQFKYDIVINGEKVNKMEALDAVLKTNDTVFGLMKGQGLKFLTYQRYYKKHLQEMHIDVPPQIVLDSIEEKFENILKTKNKEDRDKLLDKLNNDLSEYKITVWYYEAELPKEEIEEEEPEELEEEDFSEDQDGEQEQDEEQEQEKPSKKQPTYIDKSGRLRDSKTNKFTSKRKAAAKRAAKSRPRDLKTGRFISGKKVVKTVKDIKKKLDKFDENE